MKFDFKLLEAIEANEDNWNLLRAFKTNLLSFKLGSIKSFKWREKNRKCKNRYHVAILYWWISNGNQ